MEAGVLIAKDNSVIHWHLPPGRTGGSLPDSRDLWEVIWENRERLLGFAHTHPWHGEAWPSTTDITTFAAIELALGRPLKWWVVTLDQIALVTREPGRGGRGLLQETPAHDASWGVAKYGLGADDVSWVNQLRAYSRPEAK